MKTENFDHIKNRMIKKAANIWGVSSNEIETSFDPVVSLLISACASEILKIENEVNESQNRITENLIQLMTPETAVGSKPAHAILHADTMDSSVTIKPEYLFYYKKKAAEKNASVKLKNIFFSPIQDFKLINANIKYLAVGNTVSKIFDKKEKEILLDKKSKSILPESTLYLGLESNIDTITFKDVSFYFELDDIENKELFYYYLTHAKWYINNKEVNAFSGFYNSKDANKISLDAIFKSESNKTHTITNQALKFYKERFVTLNPSKVKIKKSNFSELDEFIKLNAIKIPPKVTWIKIEFPRVITNNTLQNVFCSVNAFPVLNRELNTLTYQMRDYINILPIKTDNYFLDIKTIENTSGEVYIPKAKNVLNKSKGTYTIRGNHLGKLDHRRAKEYLIHLIELLKDESASFSFLNNDFLHNNLKNLNQLISLLEKKVSGVKMNLTETNYITLEPFHKRENLLIEYWTTNGDEGNNIKSGIDVDVYKAIGVKQKGSYLLTPTIDGRKSLTMDDRLNAYRSSLLSRDRIVTKEDVKALCYEIYSNKIEAIDIKKGYTNNIELNKGITQCIEVCLFANKSVMTNDNQWETLNSNLLLQLEKKSINIFPYKIKIVT